MMNNRKIFRRMWLIPFFMIGTGAFVGLAIMGLWNWIMPAIFGLGMISFWQAIGLLILGRLLFGGFRSRRHWVWRRRPQFVYARCDVNQTYR